MFLSNLWDISETCVMPCIVPPETRLAPVSLELQWRLGGGSFQFANYPQKVKVRESWIGNELREAAKRWSEMFLRLASRHEGRSLNISVITTSSPCVCRTKYVSQSKFDYNSQARQVIKTFQSCLLLLHFCKLVCNTADNIDIESTYICFVMLMSSGREGIRQ